jgi:CelD/BcsL family acetyltransferase involved in cellulose biosynthesis
VKGRVIAVSDLTEDEVLAWSDLGRRAVHINPLFEADCLVLAARHLRYGADISVVVAEEFGRLYGCFPVQRAPNWERIHRPVLMPQTRRGLYDGTPLLDRERGHEAMVAMLQACQEQHASGAPGLVVFDWVDDASEVALHLRQAAATLGLRAYDYQRWQRPMLRRRADGDYRAIHGKKFLHNIDRLRRRLGEELDSTVQVVDRRDDCDAIRAFIELEGAGYKGPARTSLNAYPDEVVWFTAVCDRFREAGRLRLWSLEAGDHTLAYQLGFMASDGLLILKITYDEAYAKYTPGLQLNLGVIDKLDAMTGVDWIDTCTFENNETMLRMYPDRRSVATIVVATGGLVDRSVLGLLALARRHLGAGSALRRHLPRR